MVFQRYQFFLLMLSAGKFLIFAEYLRKDLFEALKLGLYPSTFGFFSRKLKLTLTCGLPETVPYFRLLSRSKCFSSQCSPERLLLCHRSSKPKIPPLSHQAELLPVRVAMLETRLFSLGFREVWLAEPVPIRTCL